MVKSFLFFCQCPCVFYDWMLITYFPGFPGHVGDDIYLLGQRENGAQEFTGLQRRGLQASKHGGKTDERHLLERKYIW